VETKLHIRHNIFSLMNGEEELAWANCYWDKLPLNGNIVRQIYITDVVSNKIGNGSLLMDVIVKHFDKIKNNPAKSGYNRSTLWLKVLPDNLRAVFLYKKFGFVEGEVQNEYMWMSKRL